VEREGEFMTCLFEILDGRDQKLEWVDPNGTVFEAIARMARCQIGCLVVLEDDQLVGLLCERDYLQKVVLRGRTSRTTVVREVMSPPTLVASLQDDSDECLRRLVAHRVKYLPVLDRDRVVGLVSRGDLLRARFAAQSEVERVRAASAMSAGTGRFAIIDAPPDSSSIGRAG